MSLLYINGISEGWFSEVKSFLKNYLNYTDWLLDEEKTINYLMELKNNYSTSSFRKRLFQIRKFLCHNNIDWANQLKAPPEPSYIPKRITVEDIRNTLDYFKNHKYYPQIKAIIYLGATTGLRAEELYQLTEDDINIDDRIVNVNHNPNNGQTTKTGDSRIAIFNEVTKEALQEYLEFYESCDRLLKLFSISHIKRLFRKAPIRVKDLRKFFSQEWDRNSGPTSIKKMLMGHSGDVDLYHYNAQNEDDLRKIYDNVMSNVELKLDTIIS